MTKTQETPRRPGRPKAATTKELISIRLSKDTLARFRATGDGWQTRLCAVIDRASTRLK